MDQAKGYYSNLYPWTPERTIRKRLMNIYPVQICWPIAFQFINNNLCSYQFINQARNECNDNKHDVIFKAKSIYETKSSFSFNPHKLFSCVSDTLNCMFHSSLPIFGPTLLFDDVWSNIVKSSGSGAPFYTKKGNLKEEARKIVETINNNNFDESVFNLPFTIYQVVQPGKSGKYKRRIVYCPPFAVTVLETVFGISPTSYFVGNRDTSIVTGHRLTYLDEIVKKSQYYHKQSGDYSSYDQTIPDQIIKLSFEIIKQFYVFDSSYQEKLFDKMVNYNLYGHIYHPLCGTIIKQRGICSGSVFTNLIDSIANLLIINYSKTILNFDYNSIYVCGDDNLILSLNKIDLDKISLFIRKYVSMELTFEKEGLVETGHIGMSFLGSYWTRDGPSRNLKRMILSCVKYQHNLPDFHGDRNLFISSRIYSIFGYDKDMLSYFLKLKLPNPVGSRIYVDWESQSWDKRKYSEGIEKPTGSWVIGEEFPWRNR